MSTLTVIRDIAIIALALESLLIGLFLIILAFQIRGLAKMLEEEVKPILDSANETISTVRGTTSFVSETVVTPLVKGVSWFSALRTVAKVMARGRRGKT